MSTPSGSSGASHSSSHRVEKKTRNRIPLNCSPCRIRKLKCNRLSPCDSCLKRGDIHDCTYASRHSRVRRNVAAASDSDDMQARIARLEAIVLSLAASQRQKDTSGVEGSSSNWVSQSKSRDVSLKEEDDDDDVGVGDEFESRESENSGSMQKADINMSKKEPEEFEDVRNALGVLKVSSDGTYFRGESHIAAILYEIQEIKQFISQHKEEREVKNNAGDIFPFAAGAKLSKAELLDLLPARATVDFLVNKYFEWWDDLVHIIHKPTFAKEYEEFWTDPNASDPLWLALLFSILFLAQRFCSRANQSPPEFRGCAEEATQTFLKAAKAALVTGELTKKAYYRYNTMTALLLLCVGMSQREQSDYTWLLLGFTCRIAMSMGLHRDPEQYKLSIFEVEMRRRLWTMLACLDLLLSTRISLPSMIREDDWDTKEPLNLPDKEIGPDVTEKPIPHDLEIETGVSYMICKSRLSRVYGKIVNLANSIKTRIPYDETLHLDSEMRTALATLPSFLVISHSNNDEYQPPSSSGLYKQFLLDMVFRKAMITLHRPWWKGAITNPRYVFSRAETIKACLKMLEHQYYLFYTERERLKDILFFVLDTAYADFMHATFILCVDLWQAHSARKLEAENDLEGYGTKAKVAALEKIKTLYEGGYIEGSIYSRKTLGVITLALNKIKAPYEENQLKNTLQQQSYSVNPLPSGQTKARSHDAAGSYVRPEQPTTITSNTGLLTQPGIGIYLTHADRQQPLGPGGFVVMDEAPSDPQSGWHLLFNHPISPAPLFGGSAPLPTRTYGDPGGAQASPGHDWNEWDNFIQAINFDSWTMGGS